MPVCFLDLADHHGAAWMLARQVNAPRAEIRAVMLPFGSVHQIEAPAALNLPIASSEGCSCEFVPVDSTAQRGRMTSGISSTDPSFEPWWVARKMSTGSSSAGSRILATRLATLLSMSPVNSALTPLTRRRYASDALPAALDDAAKNSPGGGLTKTHSAPPQSNR